MVVFNKIRNKSGSFSTRKDWDRWRRTSETKTR